MWFVWFLLQMYSEKVTKGVKQKNKKIHNSDTPHKGSKPLIKVMQMQSG